MTVTATSFSPVTVSAPGGGETDGAGTPVLPPPSSGQLVWQETVSVPLDFDLDLDEAKPVVARILYVGDFTAAVVGNGAGGRLATSARAGRPSSPTPTREECRDAIDTAAVAEPFSMDVGKTVCVLSTVANGSHVAALRLRSYDKPGRSLSLDVTVWTAD